MNDPGFVQALVRLNTSHELDSETAYRVGRICQSAMKEMEKASVKEKAIIGKFEKDAEGNFKTTADEVKCGEELNKLFEKNMVEIKVNKLRFKGVKGLSGVEMVAIECILDGIPEVA